MGQNWIFRLLRQLAGGCCLAGFLLSSALAEEVIVSWDTMDPGLLGVRWAMSPDARWIGNTYLASARNMDVEVLGTGAEKAKAFGGIPVLRVGLDPNPDAPSLFALRGRPFFTPSKKGGLEFQFALESGKMHITLGQNPAVFEERNDQTVLLRSDDAILHVTLEVNSALLFGKMAYESQSTVSLQAGRPYKLRILWDFEGPDPHFTAFLDGEPLVTQTDGVPLLIKVKPEEGRRGIDSFVLTGERNGGSSYCVGNILSVDP